MNLNALAAVGTIKAMMPASVDQRPDHLGGVEIFTYDENISLRDRSPSVTVTSERRPDLQVFETVNDLRRFAHPSGSAVMLDLDDIESHVTRQRLRIIARHELDVTSSSRLPWLPPFLRVTAIRVRRLPGLVTKLGQTLVLALRQSRNERWAVRTCDVVLVCSESDRKRLGSESNLVVVPNVFEGPRDVRSTCEPHTPPLVAFWGAMTYAPNADAARWLVRHIFPLIQQEIPDAQLVIAGRGGFRLGLSEQDHVRVSDFIEDLPALLQEIDVLVVPLRAGGGTRIKILEAWAHSIPVVSTKVGAYGLDTEHGRELLVGRTAQDLAGAVCRVLGDLELRRRLIDNGRRRLGEYAPTRAADAIARAVDLALEKYQGS